MGHDLEDGKDCSFRKMASETIESKAGIWIVVSENGNQRVNLVREKC